VDYGGSERGVRGRVKKPGSTWLVPYSLEDRTPCLSHALTAIGKYWTSTMVRAGWLGIDIDTFGWLASNGFPITCYQPCRRAQGGDPGRRM